MSKKERVSDDLMETTSIDINSEDGIEDTLIFVEQLEIETIQDMLTAKYATYIDLDKIKLLLEAYDIDTEDTETATKQVYNTYRKEFG